MSDDITTDIILGDGYRLRQDKFCCWIEKETDTKNKKTGETSKTWRRVAGYCPDYESLFKDLYQKRCYNEIKSGDVGNAIREMGRIYTENKKMIERVVGRMK